MIPVSNKNKDPSLSFLGVKPNHSRQTLPLTLSDFTRCCVPKFCSIASPVHVMLSVPRPASTKLRTYVRGHHTVITSTCAWPGPSLEGPSAKCAGLWAPTYDPKSCLLCFWQFVRRTRSQESWSICSAKKAVVRMCLISTYVVPVLWGLISQSLRSIVRTKHRNEWVV
jgi:hypothetical protein